MSCLPEVARYFPDRRKFVTLAAGCLILGLGCVLKILDAGPSAPTVLGAGACLLGAMNCAQSLDRSRCHIELGPEGFTERSPLRARRIRWSEVAEFDLLPLPRKNVWVVYRLSPTTDPRVPEWVRRTRRREFGLADTYGLDPCELVELLNAWRLRFAPATDATQPIGDAA